MELVPIEEKNKWSADLKPILTEMNKLSGADKIEGFRDEVVGRYIAHKSLAYIADSILVVVQAPFNYPNNTPAYLDN